jgi:twinkle protein
VKQAGNVDRPTEGFIREVMGWLDGWLWVFGLVGKTAVSRIIEVFEYARCRYGCDVFVIDSLMRLGIGSEDYEGQEKAVFELVSWAVAKGVHVHLVAHARKSDRAASHAVPDVEDVKGTSEIAANAANIIGIWRNRKLEDEIRIATEAADRGDAEAQLKLEELTQKPPVIVNVAKQRNGDWEGKFGLWFNPQTYQYRSAHDDRHGRKFVSSGSVPLSGAA